MRKFAVIDVGSNSVRLMLVADGKVLYKSVNTTRLGEGLAERPVLTKEAIERTALAVAQNVESFRFIILPVYIRQYISPFLIA